MRTLRLRPPAGDIFLLGSTSWKIRRVENKGIVRVEDAHGAPPTIPFWLGEAPGRSIELSAAVGELRREIGGMANDPESASRYLQRECHMQAIAAEQMVEYLAEAQESLQVMPSDTDVVFERFFDEGGGQQLVVHAPFGSGVNRAWGLALRKRFCVRFDFELQAAANEEGILLSLGPTQSFPLEEAFEYLRSDNAEQSLRQAVLYAPFWNTRWRWAATRAPGRPSTARGEGSPTLPATNDRRRLAGRRLPRAGRLPGEPGRAARGTRPSADRTNDGRLPARSGRHRRADRRAGTDRARRDSAARPRHGDAVGDGAEHHQHQPVRIPRRRTAGGASRARRDDPAHAAQRAARPGQVGHRRDRARPG